MKTVELRRFGLRTLIGQMNYPTVIVQITNCNLLTSTD